METSVNNKCMAFTSLEQSKKLEEILPHESADMYYPVMEDNIPCKRACHKDLEYIQGKDIECWSLAALLAVLPFHLIVNNQRFAFSMHKGLNKDGETYTLDYSVYNTDVCLYSTDYYNNPVDAAFEMTLKLHELNLL